MALSTSMPRARISEKSTIMFRVISNSARMMIDMSMEKGMAQATKKALRPPNPMKMTKSTNKRDVPMPFSKSDSIMRTSLL